MNRIEQIRKRRGAVLKQLAELEQIRRGTVTEQVFQAQRKDGSKVQRGPYPLYTFKDKGKTRSRRITDRRQVPIYEEQIQAFRRFEALSAELVQLGEETSELALSEEEELKKKPKSNSRKKSN